MKKKALVMAIVCALTVAISACGASATEDSTSKETVEQVEEATETNVEVTEAVSDSSEETTGPEEIVDESEEPEEPEESLLSVVGIYFGDIYANQKGNCYSDQGLDGFSDCIVVFDYTNDSTNRTLPASNLEQPGHIYSTGFTCPDVTLVVNDANTYEAYDPNGYDGHYSNALNRYTSYSNPVGYGNLLGGADPVRMYAVFYVNPNELKSDSSAVLTVVDQSVEFDFTDIKEITYPDEILACEENYEELQQIAAFKWRMDKIVDLTGEVDHYMASMNPGSDLSGVGNSILSLFSSDYGVTISGQLPAGFGPDHTYDGMNTDLPPFNVDTLTSALPDQAEDIAGLVDATNRLGAAVQDSGYSKSDIENILKEILGYYANLTSAFDMEMYKG